MRVDPTGSSSLSMGPLMKPFSTSFIVAAKRLRSISVSPELCTDSKRTPRLRLETFLRSSQVMLAGRNFWVKTPDLGSAPLRSKPLLMSSTKPKSSWPASVSSVSKRQSLLSLSTSAILGLRDDFNSCSLVTSSVDKATHLLTSSVRSLATWWIVLLDRCPMLALTSLGDKELCSVGWQRRPASVKNSSGEKRTPTVTWWSLISLALATYPLSGVLSKQEWDGKGVWESWCKTCLNSGTSGGKFLRGWMFVEARMAWSVHSCSAKLGKWHTIP